MDVKSEIKTEIKRFINKMKMEHFDILPHVFGQLFEDMGLKTYDVCDETVIPTVLCINGPVLNKLATFKTAIHIYNYLKAITKTHDVARNMLVVPDVTRVSAMILMLSSVEYSFNEKTVPFIKNNEINQMWADIEQLAKADHVGSVLIAVAARGRSYEGFVQKNAPRMKNDVPYIMPVPYYVKGPNNNNNNIIRLNQQPKNVPFYGTSPQPHDIPQPKTLGLLDRR